MNRQYLTRIAATAIISIAITACGHDHSDHEHEHEHEDGIEAADHEDNHEAHEHEGHKHGDEITLSPEAARRFGVKTDTLQPGNFSEVITVSGQIMPASSDLGAVSASTSGIFTLSKGVTVGSMISPGTAIGHISAKGISGGDPNVAAKVEIEAARRELDRLTPLLKDGIVSQKDYNAAQARLKAAEAAYSAPAASGTAVANVGGVITEIAVRNGEYVEAGQLIAVVSRNTRVTLRADVPEKYFNFLPHITSANFRPDYLDTTLQLSSLGGRLVSAPTGSTAVSGYIPVYFSFDNRGDIVPGAFAEVYLQGNERREVLTVPVTSLVEVQGNKYVFTREHEDAYLKHLVSVGATDGTRVEILSGLHPGQVVVTEGARVISMAETSNVAPPGHSHNH